MASADAKPAIFASTRRLTLPDIEHMNTTRFLLLVAALAANAHAGLRPAPVFTDNMVLQRDTTVPVWGTAAPGEEVTVGFAGQEATAKAGADGRWRVDLQPLAASKEPGTMTVTGAAAGALSFTNVLVGEVWLCSGQSNMEWSVEHSADFEREKSDANQPLIRHFKVPRKHLPFPAAEMDASWVICTPETVAPFTAAGYFFARELVRELDVPVGLLNASFGGTQIEPWISPEAAMGSTALPELAALARKAAPSTPEGKTAYEEYLKRLEEWVPRAKAAVAAGSEFPAPVAEPWITGNEQQLTRLHNGMIVPIIPYAIRGALWYQGESNAGKPSRYLEKMQTLAEGWRTAWSRPEMPFYLVQLAGHQRSKPDNPAMGDGWARLREEQAKALALPGFGVAAAIDIGETDNIHPANKQDVGKRLALWALAKTYGRGGPVSGPVFRSSRVEDGKVVVEFDHADSGLIFGRKTGPATVEPVTDSGPKWISIAGADKVFHWAEAVIDGSRLLVRSDKVPEPVAVRYAFTQHPEGVLLYNKDNLPALPFRTDTW